MPNFSTTATVIVFLPFSLSFTRVNCENLLSMANYGVAIEFMNQLEAHQSHFMGLMQDTCFDFNDLLYPQVSGHQRTLALDMKMNIISAKVQESDHVDPNIILSISCDQ